MGRSIACFCGKARDNPAASSQLPGLTVTSYGLPCGDGAGEVAGFAGVTLPAGKTPAPESGAGEETGEGFAVVGAGEVWGAACVFISSRRNALSAVPLWA